MKSMPSTPWLAALLVWTVSTGVADAEFFHAKIAFGTPRKPAAPTNKYFAAARDYADFMVDHGRDRIGPRSTPMFHSVLNVSTGAPPGESGEGTASDPQSDEDLYRLLYLMSYVTQNARYALAADSALEFFFNHCQGAQGFFAWGEHGLYNTLTDGASAHSEHDRVWRLHDEAWRFAPEAMRKAADGFWYSGVGDKEKGWFNRHACSSCVGAEFPGQGGAWMTYWAEAYKRTWNETMLDYMDVLVRYFDGARLDNGLLPRDHGSLSVGNMTSETIRQTQDVWTLSRHVPSWDPRRKRYEEYCLRNDQGWMQSSGYPESWSLYSGEGRRAAGFISGYVWGRYYQLLDGGYNTEAEGYRASLLRMADRHVGVYPVLTEVNAVNFGDSYARFAESRGSILGGVILMLVHASRVSGDRDTYLAAARDFADLAIAKFLDGAKPLPRLLPGYSYYQTSESFLDTLMLALFVLGVELGNPEIRILVENVN